MATDIQISLSKALATISTTRASLVADPLTDVTIYPTQFLKHYQIYQVKHFNPYKPILFYIGFAPNKGVYSITDTPETYVQLSKADGVSIEKTEIAINYAEVYLEVTRSMTQLFYVIKGIKDIRFRPNLNDNEQKTKQHFEHQYQTIITPPGARQTVDGYSVKLYAIREQTLETHILTISRMGNIKDNISKVEQNLPLVYGL